MGHGSPMGRTQREATASCRRAASKVRRRHRLRRWTEDRTTVRGGEGRGSDAIDDGFEVRRLVFGRLLQLLDGCLYCAAVGMSENDDEPGVEQCGREFDAADLGRRYDIARNAHDEKVAEALVEHDFGRYARVGAAKNNGERVLFLWHFTRWYERRLAVAHSFREASIAFF